MDKNFTAYTTQEFLNELASSSPAPGGGSVAGMELCQGVSLCIMVLCLTVGKGKYAAFEEENQALLAHSRSLLEKCLSLADEDRTAFLPLSAAYKMPSSTVEEIREKKAALGQGAKKALEVPLKVLSLCSEVLPILERLSVTGSRLALSDVGVGAMCVLSAAKSAWLNVLINLPSLTEKEFGAASSKDGSKNLKEVEKKCLEIYSFVEKEIGI